uniref:GOST seven transmembrane domain-containing protein n=1 Tax=Gossypium raimondii TaxID=29730 RepID=A0A0D2NX08_GOSRA|nr:hypothetical protein B456_003G068800 [Gossypium raimondii]
MYNLYFIHCDLNLKDLTVEGKTVWKNPTGYLPGRVAPLMNFYGFMSLAFVILEIFWFLQYARFWREVLPLQNCITLVITLVMLEMALWYFDYGEFNGSGLTSKVTMLGATFFLASEILELVENVGAVSDLSRKAKLFLVLPVSILDAFFILWIFTSFSSTLNKLQVFFFFLQLHRQIKLITIYEIFSLMDATD